MRSSADRGATCASGSEILWNGRREQTGKPHSNIACFSFHPHKVITTGDGGMLTTANTDSTGSFGFAVSAP